MYVERVLSINNGWSVLTTQKQSEWYQLTEALNVLDIESIKAASSREGSKNLRTIDWVTYFVCVILNNFVEEDCKWTGFLPDTERYTSQGIPLNNGLAFYVATLRELPNGAFTNTLFVQAPYLHNLGELDILVVVAPTKSTKEFIVSQGITPTQVDGLITEDDCRAQLARFGPLNSQIPIVLAFYSIEPSDDILVEELASIKPIEHVIERTIEFAPEFYQAGVDLLSYFGTILRQKDPNTKAKVRIEQDGTTVRLHIVPPVGEAEMVEEHLEKFALVISDQASPETLLTNQAHIVQLKSQLAMAQLQVQTAQEIKQITDGVNAYRFANLEKQVETLNMQLAAQLLQSSKVIDLAAQQASSHERMQAALLTHSQTLFQDLLREASTNQRLAEAVSSLQHNLLSGIATIDIEDKLEQALSTIKETKPGFLGRIQKELEGAVYKAAAGSTVTWVATWLAAHAQ